MVLYTTQPETLSPADPCNKVISGLILLSRGRREQISPIGLDPDQVDTSTDDGVNAVK
jgi:hypothetical protein